MSSHKLTLIFIVSFVFTSIAFSQFDESRYKSARLDTISFFPVERLNDSLKFIILDTPMSLRPRLVYADSARTLDSLTHNVLRDWLEEVIQKPAYIEYFAHELLFFQNNKPFWLPVQESLIPEFKKKAQKGGLVDLYVVIAGSTKERVIFSLNGFDLVK